jgi:predicted exporter
LVIWLLFLLLGAWQVFFHTKISTDLASFLPRSVTRNQQLLLTQLQQGAASRLLLIALEGDNPQNLARISKDIAQQCKSSGLFNYVNNGEQLFSKQDQQLLMQYRYLLSPSVNADRFSVESLHNKLNDYLAMLSSPAGLLSKSLLATDPTAEFLEIVSEFSAANSPQTRYGVWFSADGRRALILAETTTSGFDVDAQQVAISYVHNLFNRAGVNDVKLLMTGAGVFSAESRANIERDASMLSLIAMIIVIGILIFIYRSGRLVVLSTLPVLSGLLIGLAAVSLSFGMVHGITLGFGAILIGEAVDYPTYLFTQMAQNENLSGTLKRIWPTLRLAILTTVLSGLSMLLTGFTGLAQLGLLLITGIVMAGLVTRWVLPALSPKNSAIPVYFSFLVDWPQWMQRKNLAPLCWVIFIVAFTFLAARYDRLWDDDLANMSPVTESTKQLDKQLRADMNVPDMRYFIVVTAPTRELALEQNEQILPWLKQLEQEKIIAGFDTAVHYLPSEKMQALRQAALPDEKSLQAALAVAVKGLPFKPGIFSEFIKDVARTKQSKPIEIENLANSAIGLKVNSLLFSQNNEWFALVPLYGVDNPAVLTDRANQLNTASVFMLDLKGEADRMISDYRKQILKIALIALLGIVIALMIGMKTFNIIPAVAPVMMAVVFVCILTSLAGYQLSLFHLVSLLLVIGVGINYALFFNIKDSQKEHRQRATLSLTLCSLTTFVAFATLIISHTPVLRIMGMTVSMGVVFSLLIAAILAKPISGNKP